MKRLILILLTLSLLVSILAFPVSAATFDDSMFINLLQYVYPNNGNSLTVNYSAGEIIKFEPNFSNNYHYIDFVFYSSSSPAYINVMTDAGYMNLDHYSIGDGMYRAFGKYESNISNRVYLEFGVPSATITFYSMNVGTMQHSYIPETAAMMLVSAGITQSGSMASSNIPLTLPLPSPLSNTDGAHEYNVMITLNEWFKYDYLEFYLDVRSLTISSIFARVGNYDIPITTNYFNGSTPGYNMWPDDSKVDGAAELRYIQVRCDFTNIDHSLSGPLNLAFNGTISQFENNNMVTLFSVNGILDQSLESPFIYFFKRMFDRIDSGFNMLQNNTNSAWNRLFGKLEEIFPSDNTAGEEFQDQLVTESGKLEDIKDEFESVTQPTVGDIDLSDDPDYQDRNALISLNTWSHWIFENSFFMRLFILVILMGTASFVLFGKG